MYLITLKTKNYVTLDSYFPDRGHYCSHIRVWWDRIRCSRNSQSPVLYFPDFVCPFADFRPLPEHTLRTRHNIHKKGIAHRYTFFVGGIHTFSTNAGTTNTVLQILTLHYLSHMRKEMQTVGMQMPVKLQITKLRRTGFNILHSHLSSKRR